MVIMMKKILKQLRDETGAVTVITAVSLTVILIFAAFTTDMGLAYVEISRSQNISDAVALSAGSKLPVKANDAAAIAAIKTVAKEYAVKNGYNNLNDEDILLEDLQSGYYNRLKVNIKRSAPTGISRIIGIKSINATKSASVGKASMGGVFNYALFSGSQTVPLSIYGSSFYVSGDVQSNYQFVMNGSSMNITGSVLAPSQITLNGSSVRVGGICQANSIITYGDVVTGTKTYSPAATVAMPEFSENIKSLAQAGGQYYAGNKTFSGSNINVDCPIYVEGNVMINASSFTGKGCIVATGDINFNASGITGSTNDSVCFYSKNGNIAINGSAAAIDGILYAPKGVVTVYVSNLTVNGRIIADRMQLYGSNYRIVSSPDDLDSLPSAGTVKLLE